MTRRFTTAKKLVIGAIAVGTVSFGTAGVAEAAPSTTVRGHSHFNCARATKVLAHIQAAESQIAPRLAKLNGAEAKALQKGNTKRADRIKARIARLESPAYKARLDKRKAKIEAKCQVGAPTAGTSSTHSADIGGAGTVSA